MRRIRLTESDFRCLVKSIVEQTLQESSVLNEGLRTEHDFKRGVYAARGLMKTMGLKDYQAAAFAGVYVEENGCDPKKVNKQEKSGNGAAGTENGGYGAGIASLTGSTKIKLEKKYGKKIEDMSMDEQVRVIAEYYRSKPYYKYIMSAKDIEEASSVAILAVAGGYGRNGQYNWYTSKRAPTTKDVEARIGQYQSYHNRKNPKGRNSDYRVNATPRRYQSGVKVLQMLRKGDPGTPV